MNKKFCIGIVSYLPDERDVRGERERRVTNLIKQLDDHFNFPIILIAQNYKEFKPDSNNIIRYDFDKLGITGARIKLREKFLESNFDYILLLDDDMVLSDNQVDYDKYVNDVLENKKEHYNLREFLVNFCTLSHEGFEKVNFDEDCSAEKGTGFEDGIFTIRCVRQLSSMNLKDSKLPKYYSRKEYLGDRKYSTWNKDDRYHAINNKKSLIKIDQIKNITNNNNYYG